MPATEVLHLEKVTEDQAATFIDQLTPRAQLLARVLYYAATKDTFMSAKGPDLHWRPGSRSPEVGMGHRLFGSVLLGDNQICLSFGSFKQPAVSYPEYGMQVLPNTSIAEGLLRNWYDNSGNPFFRGKDSNDGNLEYLKMYLNEPEGLRLGGLHFRMSRSTGSQSPRYSTWLLGHIINPLDRLTTEFSTKAETSESL